MDAYGPYHGEEYNYVTFYRGNNGAANEKWNQFELVEMSGGGYGFIIKGRKDLGYLGTKDGLLVITKTKQY